jgi:hypothetical protein
MANTTIPTFPVNNYILQNIVDIGDDGQTPDTAEALAITNSSPSIVSTVVNPGNPRQVKITGLTAGSYALTVTAPGVPPLAALNISGQVSAAANLSRIDAGTVEGPFPV